MPKKKAKQKPVILKEIIAREEWASLYPLVRQLNPDLKKKQFSSLLKEMLKYGYRCIGAYRGGKLVGAMGLWTGHRFWCGKYIEVDNLVVDLNQRSAGIGKKMQDWLDLEAQRLKCRLVIADSYTHNHASHRFYLRERYIIKGYCFVKELY
jgi:GNAT superfamily N-acetyltransferase